MNLPQPTTQLQEVLLELLNKKEITVRQIMAETGILHVKARLLDLRRKGLPIDGQMIKTTNKYGRTCRYGSWSLTDKKAGKEMYMKLLKTEKNEE